MIRLHTFTAAYTNVQKEQGRLFPTYLASENNRLVAKEERYPAETRRSGRWTDRKHQKVFRIPIELRYLYGALYKPLRSSLWPLILSLLRLRLDFEASQMPFLP